MVKRQITVALLLGLCASFLVYAPIAKAQTVPDQPLVQSGDISRVGAFRLDTGESYFSYAGPGLSYYLDPGTGKKTLFLSGHLWHNKIGQVDVSGVPGTSTVWSSLPLAPTLQRPEEISEGRMSDVGYSPINYGTLAYNNRLILGTSSSYDGAGTQTLTHGASGLNFSILNDFVGYFPMSGVGNPRSKGGWMGLIPPEWQSVLGGPALTGNCCLSIISATSAGPAINVFDPNDVGVRDPVPATTLLFYPIDHPLAPGCSAQSTLWNCTTKIVGVFFPPGTNSVLFVGTQGTGPVCYKSTQGPESCWGTGGYNAPPYHAQIWAYDADELLAVKNAQKQTWEVQPYATWDITHLFNGDAVVSGAGYDPIEGRLYVYGFSNGEGEKPTVYVLDVNTEGGSSNPIVGDINLDHIVNSIDYSILNSDWFTSNSRSDLNNDGLVNAIDYSILNNNWFRTW